MNNTHRRVLAFMAGLLTFGGVHLIEVRMWSTWFGGRDQPWFLNGDGSGAFLVICLFIASVIAGGFYLPGPSIAAGALVGMAVVLFNLPDGPGSIFPIVLAVGGVIALIACWPAAFLGKELRGLVTRRRATR